MSKSVSTLISRANEPEKWRGKDIPSSSDTFPQCNICEMGLNLTIQFVLLSPLTNAGTAFEDMLYMHTGHPRYWSSPVVTFIASNIFQGLNVQDHKINTFMFHKLRNDISRNYPLNIWYLQQAVPETIGQCLQMGFLKSQHVRSRCCPDQTGILILNHR